uniref:Uncharacterized protein n=1 Tax=Arundo donax TaxID=35708 RepID=A0A0A9BVS3_ARUDO
MLRESALGHFTQRQNCCSSTGSEPVCSHTTKFFTTSEIALDLAPSLLRLAFRRFSSTSTLVSPLLCSALLLPCC